MAPARIGAASSPTTMRPVTPARAACPPTSSWMARDRRPSSYMGPSTANDRLPRAMTASVSIAAAMASGLAL